MDYLREDRMAKLLIGNNERQLEHLQNKYGDQFAAIAKAGKFPGIDSATSAAYNLGEEEADAIRRGQGDLVALPEDQRAGMLTHPAWLVAFSGNFDNDPIRRGKWIRERLLADLVPDIPIEVDAKVPEDPHRTLRQRLDIVREEKCWRCHKQMNPLGEPFESYDDFGKFRESIVLGDADAYFKALRRYRDQRKRWQQDLADWRKLDAAGRAEKVAHAEQMLADLKPPEPGIENFQAQQNHYEGDLKRWTKEREHWGKIDDAEQQRRIEALERQLAGQVMPDAEMVPVDASGELRGTGDPALDGKVEGAVDLARRLAKSERVRQSFVRHAFRYWMGRNETFDDSPTLIAADRAYVESGGSFKALLVSLLTSDSFLYRR
ncbi:MAG: DUF1588 domain-containing protein [Verrucomicrobiales bacterium]